MRPRPVVMAAGLFLILAARDALAQQPAPPLEPAAARDRGPFIVEPYIQLGDAPLRSPRESLQVLWHAGYVEAGWSVEHREDEEHPWRPAAALGSRGIALAGMPPHQVCWATLEGLRPGGGVEYRVGLRGKTVFSARTQAPKGSSQPHRFVVFGDCGTNTAGQKAVAYQAYRARPDFVFIAGDIVYNRGRAGEYREKFWPVDNADGPRADLGAPLLRSTLFLAAPGNHDILDGDLEAYPDGLAYFLYWSQPLNGPSLKPGAANTPELEGPIENRRAFLSSALPAFPRMASFSFEYGNAHWTVLDSNPYVDWADPELHSWLERDLAAGAGATWRFVAFHHPGFNSSKKHFSEQRMRRLAETFEKAGVDVVFNGHVHNYQRTYPLRFVAETPKAARKRSATGANDLVAGRWTLDKEFDGKTRTRPDGVIYLVTGAGGASLYDPEQTEAPETWQEFTHKFLARTHSLTVAEVDGKVLTVRQVSANGDEIDRFVVTR